MSSLHTYLPLCILFEEELSGKNDAAVFLVASSPLWFHFSRLIHLSSVRRTMKYPSISFSLTRLHIHKSSQLIWKRVLSLFLSILLTWLCESKMKKRLSSWSSAVSSSSTAHIIVVIIVTTQNIIIIISVDQKE